jgi:outer membrane protein assembly factor BamB
VFGAFAAAFALPLALALHFLVWTAWRAPQTAPVTAGPLLAAGRVLVALADGALVSFAAEDGAERWRAACGAKVPAEGLAAGAGVVACVAGARASLFDADSGAPRFSRELGAALAAVSLAGESVAVAAGDAVHALSPDGATRWSATPWSGREIAALRSEGGSLIAVGAGGVAALDLANGLLRWQIDLGAPVVAAPRFGDDAVFVLDAGTPPRVHALALGDGALRWSGEGETVPVQLGGEALDASAATLRARDARSGRPHWEKMGFEGAWSAAPVRAGGRVVVGFAHTLHGYTLAGESAFSTIRRGGVGPRLAGDDARVYYVEDGSTLVALDAE